nr:hypothetical protein [Tanacetum cinerariifolium]
MGYEKTPPKLTFYKAFFSARWKFLIHTLVQCLRAKRTAWNDFNCSMASAVICLAIGKGFSGVETPLFASMMVPQQPQAKEEVEEQPTTTSESSMSLLTTLIETCATQSQKVAELEQDKYSQALDILELKKRVKKLEKKKRSKPLGFKRLRRVGGKIEAIDADEDITLVDVETDKEVVAMDAEPQGRINQEDVNAATKGFSAAELTVFNNEEVTMIMAQTLIKLKAEKAKFLDEQIAQKLHDEEIQKMQPGINKKRMIWKELKCFKNRMTYDKVMPIFEREYKKVQTLFKPDKDVEEPKKKRVVDETLFQESFKKLKAVEVSGFESTQEIPSNDLKEMTKKDVQNMLEIVPVSEFKVKALQVKYCIIDWEIHTEGSRTYWKIIRVGGITEAYQSFEDMLKGFDREDLVALWNLVKEKFSPAVPSVDKEKAL